MAVAAERSAEQVPSASCCRVVLVDSADPEAIMARSSAMLGK
jgi:hypothetical protein